MGCPELHVGHTARTSCQWAARACQKRGSGAEHLRCVPEVSAAGQARGQGGLHWWCLVCRRGQGEASLPLPPTLPLWWLAAPRK